MKKGRVTLPLVVMAGIASNSCFAQTVAMFNADLLKAIMPQGQSVDLSYFEQGLSVPPGFYTVDVFINKRLTKKATFDFRIHNGELLPVLTKNDLIDFGFKFDELPSLEKLNKDDEIFPITDHIAQLGAFFDGPNLTLNLTVPQIYLLPSGNQYIDVASPELWDNGIAAAVLNYSLTGSHYDARHQSGSYTQNLSLLLNGQINLGAWRLFSNGLFHYSKTKFLDQGHKNEDWDYWNTYLQRDVPYLKSTVKVGEISTSSSLFDSFSMRGLSIGTNEQMIPYADRSFVPTITGVANSFAQVFIKQNNHIVYQMNVPPGPWKIDTLPSLNSDGDLTVVVREADGSERVEVVPYASVPMMLRQGQFRYDFNLGKYHGSSEDKEVVDPWFGELTVAYGLPWNTTLLAGVLLNESYQAYTVGTAFSLGNLGALSFDVIHSKVSESLNNEKAGSSGSTYRVRYEKTLASTGTSVNIASYRYMTKDYYSFADLHQNDSVFPSNRMKHRWQLSLSQSLGDWGHVNAWGNYVTYYDNTKANKTWSISYSKQIHGIGTSISYQRAYEKRNGQWNPDERLMLNVSVPLGRFIGQRTNPLTNVDVDYQANVDRTDAGKDFDHRVSVRYHEPNSDWSWRVSQVMGDNKVKESSLIVSYDGDRLTGNASYTRNDAQNSYFVSLGGGVVAHADGVAFSSRIYDSVALVSVPDVPGVKINQSANVHTDAGGYAVITNLRNYMPNEVVIDPTTLPEGALLIEGTHKKIYPTSRSVTKVVYPVRLGYQALVYLSQADGTPLPFGVSVVLDEDEQSSQIVSIVGENGRAYFSGLPRKGTLKARWSSNGRETEATFDYEIPLNSGEQDFVSIPHLHLIDKKGEQAL